MLAIIEELLAFIMLGGHMTRAAFRQAKNSLPLPPCLKHVPRFFPARSPNVPIQAGSLIINTRGLAFSNS